MIKFEIGPSGVSCEISGTLTTLCAEMTTALKTVYDGIMNKSEDAAMEFKKLMEEDLCRLAFADPEEVRADVAEKIEKMDSKKLMDLVMGLVGLSKYMDGTEGIEEEDESDAD